jgi:hypothetical protein
MHTTSAGASDVARRASEGIDVAAERHSDSPDAPVFLLSPASLSGVRGRRLLEGGGSASVAERMARGEGVPLGEVYASISSLYFRGKLAYARRFARRPLSVGVRVITPDRGLCAAEESVRLEDLRRMARTAIDERQPTYRGPLCESARELALDIPASVLVVLLGSLATRKYLEPLSEVLGERLRVPRAFIGLGDMRRGGMLLRAVAEGRELDYVEASAAMGARETLTRQHARSHGELSEIRPGDASHDGVVLHDEDVSAFR